MCDNTQNYNLNCHAVFAKRKICSVTVTIFIANVKEGVKIYKKN